MKTVLLEGSREDGKTFRRARSSMKKGTPRDISLARTLGLLVLVTSIMALPGAAAQGPTALDQPHTVYVYNGTTDTFNNNAQGYIWQQLGLLDANGKPGTVQGNDIVNDSGKVVGHVIRDGGNNIIGYTNAEGTVEAYDVSAGATTAQAWNRVAANGTLHIIKHGAGYTGDNGEPHDGGGIQLDGGTTYDGFDVPGGGGGTGVGYGHGPYPLPPRPGANITVNVNSCWSSNDPDGGGAESSVTDSASRVPGVGATQGHAGKVEARLQIQLSGGTPAQRQAAWNALQAAAAAAGFRDKHGGTGPNEVAQWLSSLSFQDQYRTAQDTVDKAVPPPGTVRVRLSYSKVETGRAQTAAVQDTGEAGYWLPPRLIRPSLFVPIWYNYGDVTPWATLTVPPGALAAPTMFFVKPDGILPAPLPPNRVVNSALMDFRVLGGSSTFSPPLRITLLYYDDGGPFAVYRYDTLLGWQQVPTAAIDPVAQTIAVDVTSFSIYVVLMQVNPGVGVAPPAASSTGLPNSAVTYAITVTNTGDYTDTISLQANGVWTTTVSTYLVPLLGAGLSESLTVTVVIPFGAQNGTSDTATITATSTISPALSGIAQVTTVVKVYKIYLPLVVRQG